MCYFGKPPSNLLNYFHNSFIKNLETCNTKLVQEYEGISKKQEISLSQSKNLEKNKFTQHYLEQEQSSINTNQI